MEISLTDPVFQKAFKAEHGCDIEEARRDESGATTRRDLGEAAGGPGLCSRATRTRGRMSSS